MDRGQDSEDVRTAQSARSLERTATTGMETLCLSTAAQRLGHIGAQRSFLVDKGLHLSHLIEESALRGQETFEGKTSSQC